ncbi:MAG: methyltransferase domain-containing protein [Nitrospirae bacterium]|nr:methyltransferase domain-containing protein [Nitrospirota bacterium]
MKETSKHKEAKRIREIVSNFWISRIILTANNLRVFDELEKPLTAKSVAKRLALDPRATELLLNSLVSLKFLRKKGNRFINTSTASKYLVRQSPFYLGDIIRHNEVLWTNWSYLNEVVKTGKPANKAFELESFILGMHNLARLKKDILIKQLNLKGIKRILDLGGGPGTYSMEFAKRGKDVYLFDRPETLEIARTLIDKEGLGDRITLLQGDFLTDPIGSDYDMVLMSQILHAYGKRDIKSLLKKTWKALNTSGILVIHEFYLDSTLTEPLTGAIFSINMLVNTPQGRTYSVRELKEFLKGSGFKILGVHRLDDTVLIRSQKRR